MWLPVQKKNIQAYSFVTVYCVNFIIFSPQVLCPSSHQILATALPKTLLGWTFLKYTKGVFEPCDFMNYLMHLQQSFSD